MVEVHEARRESDLRRELERRGYHIFELRPRGLLSQLALPRLKRDTRGISMRQLLIYNQELAALLRAGLPLLQALDLMLERMRDPAFRAVLTEIRDQVRSGADLSEAVAGFGALFPPLYSSTLKAGERSGELEQVIRRFMRYQRLVMDARKRVVSALVYPAVLIGLSVVMILVMTIYVVPRFTVFYADLDAELPLMTQAVLAVSTFMRENWPVLLVALVVGVFAFLRWSESAVGEVTVARLKLRVPILGSIFARIALSEFCRSLSTLLAGGIPLLPSLETAVGAVGNPHIRRELRPTVGAVREGEPFYEALEETGVVSELAVDMVKVGEATGSLDAMLSSVSDFLDDEVDTLLQRILGLIEPIMLMIMGLIVASLLLAVYLPLFSALGRIQ